MRYALFLALLLALPAWADDFRVIRPQPAEEIPGAILYNGVADYITADPVIPPDAIYAARMDAKGVTVILPAPADFNAVHTFAGWPVPREPVEAPQ